MLTTKQVLIAAFLLLMSLACSRPNKPVYKTFADAQQDMDRNDKYVVMEFYSDT